jgi:hypothetical protein
MKVLVGSLDRDTVAKACKRFRSRIEAFITANNHFLENLALSLSLCYFFLLY